LCVNRSEWCLCFENRYQLCVHTGQVRKLSLSVILGGVAAAMAEQSQQQPGSGTAPEAGRSLYFPMWTILLTWILLMQAVLITQNSAKSALRSLAECRVMQSAGASILFTYCTVLGRVGYLHRIDSESLLKSIDYSCTAVQLTLNTVSQPQRDKKHIMRVGCDTK
jgi:hypothetical protein